MTQSVPLEEAIFEQGFQIIDNFLNPVDCNALLATIMALYEADELCSAKVGNQQNTALDLRVRRDKILWLDEQSADDALKAYFAAIKAIQSTLNQAFFLGLRDFEAHFAVYNPGSFYKKHVDQFVTTQERKISCVYYLNPQWRSEFGGELVLYDKDDNLLTKIDPIGNRLVCFRSELPHEVLTTHETRFSIAGWLKTRKLMLVD